MSQRFIVVVVVTCFLVLALSPYLASTKQPGPRPARSLLPVRNSAAAVKSALDAAAPPGSSRRIPSPLSPKSSAKLGGANQPASARLVPPAAAPQTPGQRDIERSTTPVNTAVYVGADVTFTCRFDPASIGVPRIQWTEFAYSPSGTLISENEFVLGHPEAARYKINATISNYQYDLQISNVKLTDGGTYLCSDVNGDFLGKYRAGVQLVVMDVLPDCSSTFPAEGSAAIEGNYYTYECVLSYQGNIVPNLNWAGPNNFTQAQIDRGTSVWSGFAIYADRSMNSQSYHLSANYTDYFLPVPEDMDDTVPTFNDEIFYTDRLNIQWGPANMRADPMHPDGNYAIGDSLTCSADALPTAQYTWLNLRTLVKYDGDTFTIADDWLGTTQTMLCTAVNTINGQDFPADLYIAVNVPIATTEPPTTPSTTTTPVPLVSDCKDLTGSWSSTVPTEGALCLIVDTDGSGSLSGGFRNGTDTVWLDLVGISVLPSFEHTAFTAIWPYNAAISTAVAECYRCMGTEILIVNVISRAKGTGICGSPGEIRYSDEYTFYRSDLKCAQFLPPGRSGSE